MLGEDYTYVSRIVIDLKYGEPARLYVQRFADDSIIDVLLGGALEIVERPAAAGPTTGISLTR